MPAPPTPDQSCPLCDAKDWRTHLAGVLDYLSGERFDLLRCESCGLVITHPAPAPAELDRYYPPRYRTDRQKQTGGWRVRRRAAMLQRHFPRGFRGRLLDLGCGTGAFALEMQRRGWTLAVTELNDAVLEEMRSRGMEAKRPDEALRDGFSGERFDAITAWHVLEHVPQPLALAKWSAEHLSSEGVFQATVPNLASWQANRFGRHWLHLDVPRHLFHFTPVTLRALVERAGMREAATSTVALEYDVFGVVQSALNGMCSRPNVLFERLTARGSAPEAPRRDVIVSWTLLPVLLAFAGVECALAGLAHRGGTLTMTCRVASNKPQ
jgi:SAM-dependent methyltransferase